MKYSVKSGSHTPAYLQIYGQIREDVINGIYPHGSKLPSKRSLAADLGVSTVTVEHAYLLLCDEGYIEARERSGYFVVFHKEDGFASSVSRVASKPPTPHKSAASHPVFPFSVLGKTMRRVLSDYGESILERSPSEGRPELRAAIRDYLARNRGIKADAEQIIIGSGAEYLYRLIVELLGRDKTYAIESPSYKRIEQVYRNADVSLCPLPLANDGIESGALCATDAAVLHTTPYRSFPSGITATASKRYEYIRWASAEGRYIIEDDFESEFSVSTKPEETLFSLSDKGNVIYLNTFSKTVSPALRVGYMVLPEGLCGEFRERLGFYSCTVPTFEQLLLAELITNGDFERHINRVRRARRREMQRK